MTTRNDILRGAAEAIEDAGADGAVEVYAQAALTYLLSTDVMKEVRAALRSCETIESSGSDIIGGEQFYDSCAVAKALSLLDSLGDEK